MMLDGLNAVPLLVPMVVYLSLSQLPIGRGALVGIGFAAVVCALAWMGAATMRPLVLVAVPGVAAAALVQGIRAVLGVRLSRGGYIALVGLPIFFAVAYLLSGVA
ncbi:MAG: hypothetical protein CVT82_06385 [Alphaproteobacteria bacterium HGW-Alphaproteobacteria-4]|jgi:hypothetical protein|nr:MAG: hypothetical protein CVT82_06385 [Alphaproteobacteria bacterium HGW-Alphaproteobacteria-4]